MRNLLIFIFLLFVCYGVGSIIGSAISVIASILF